MRRPPPKATVYRPARLLRRGDALVLLRQQFLCPQGRRGAIESLGSHQVPADSVDKTCVKIALAKIRRAAKLRQKAGIAARTDQ